MNALVIDAEWALRRDGPAEERACFAEIGIRHNDRWLTEAEDRFTRKSRTSAHLSGYKLAEWLAWNWWRLRWEPRKTTSSGKTPVEWLMSHRLTAIGGGYVWPNITFYSDGERVVTVAEPTKGEAADSIRYTSSAVIILRAADFECSIDAFLEQVKDQLHSESVTDTNFERIWDAVREERQDAQASAWRRLEAVLGHDPDEADPAMVERLLSDSNELGQGAVVEMAAGYWHDGIPTSQALRDLTRLHGYDFHSKETVRLKSRLPIRGTVPAWRRGSEAARALRQQEGLGTGPLSNQHLATMAGVGAEVMRDQSKAGDFAFALDGEGESSGRILLHSPHGTGRRFELARLLGDRITGDAGDRLHPALNSYTYRQQTQRSFAAELLCPFSELDDMLDGNYSADAIRKAAHRFDVSQRTVRTLLVNYRRINRTGLADDMEAGLAA